jgi:hypothetical protein
MRYALLVAALLFVIPGCSKAGGFDSPEAVGKAFVEAVNAGDPAAVKAVFPTDELLKASIECKETKMFERVAKGRDGMVKEMGDDLKGVKLEWKGTTAGKEETLAAGSEKEGCKAKVDVVMAKHKWQFAMTKDGKSEDEGEGVRLIKLGDNGWFLFSM